MTYQPELEIILEEPWVRLHNNADLKNWNKEDEIRWNQVHRQTEKYKFFINVFDYLSENYLTGDYYEFGCHRCRTFRMALTEARHHNMDNMRFLAFDSFEGLPLRQGEDGMGEKWGAGKLSTSQDQFKAFIQQHGLYTDKTYLYSGYYDRSLNSELIAELKQMNSFSSFIAVDCDFYESAVPIFKFIEEFLQEGTIIYIDDLFAGYKGNAKKGVGRAFLEHQSISSWKFLPHINIGWWGRSYIVCKKD